MDSQNTVGPTNFSTASRHPYGAVCFKSVLVTSSGIWLGNSPFSFSLPLMMTQMVLFVATSHFTHYFLKRVGQPLVVSQIVAGMIFGPMMIGANKSFADTMFPQLSKMYIDTVAGYSLMLFLFMIGVKTDLSMLRKSGKKAIAVGLTSSFIPFGLMAALGYALSGVIPAVYQRAMLPLQLTITWSRTSYVVLSCLLEELNLLNSKLGRIAMSGTLVEEFINTILTTISSAVQLGLSASTPMNGLVSFLSFVLFLLFILFVARPLTIWMIRRTPEGDPLDEAYFMTVLVIVFTCGFVGELIGHHATTGAFLLGLALPGGAPLGSTLDDKLMGLVSSLGMPVFMALAGYKTDLTMLLEKKQLVILMSFVVVAAFGKMVGVLGPCFYCKMPFRDAVTVGLMMNTKGIFEIYMLNIWMDGQILDRQSYSVMVIFIVLFAGVTTPLIKALYKPSMRYVAYKRRTIQHAKPEAELRMLVCVRSEDNVDPVIRLLDSSMYTKDAPICIYVLHTVQLVGQTAARLAPYKRHNGGTESDHIVNAFRYLERRNKDTMLVQPFVSVSPMVSVHDDICSLSLDKKVALVIMPFHKKRAIDGSMEATSHAYRTTNINVLDYAPCSVGILIDHGSSIGGSNFSPACLLQHLGVYFIGGPDDRESLSLAVRMVGNSTIPLTVVRFTLPKEWRQYTPEQKADDEVVNDFRLRSLQKQNVTYREVVVKDGEETVAVVSSMKDFSLLIVGRRHGIESPMTAGLSMWSEYPELGVIGDMLASTDYGGNVSTMVVQQQTRVGCDQGDGVNCHFGLGSRLHPKVAEQPKQEDREEEA